MVRTAALPELLERYRPGLERALRAAVSGRGLPFYRLIRYHLGFCDAEANADEARDGDRDRDGEGDARGGGYLGKALRASLVLFAHEALSGDWHPALPAAVAVELVHSFSLVHDDIQDRDEERHGRPTVWRLWGPGQAINVGDALRELAALSLHRLRLKGLPVAVVLRAARVLDRATLRMIEGQYLDLSYEERLDLTVEDYLEMVVRKTGALIGAALELGALLARPDEPRLLQHFRDAGHRLGLAFQARDDLLGIWGDPQRTGKPASSDILNRKKSLPIVYTLAGPGPEAAELRRLYSLPRLGEPELAQILEILERCGAREWTQARAAEFCAQAARLGEFLPGWARRLWEELLEFVIHRER